LIRALSCAAAKILLGIHSCSYSPSSDHRGEFEDQNISEYEGTIIVIAYWLPEHYEGCFRLRDLKTRDSDHIRASVSLVFLWSVVIESVSQCENRGDHGQLWTR